MTRLNMDTLVKNNQAMHLKTHNIKDIAQASDFIGDFNGDGIDDFVLSAPFVNNISPTFSTSYIIYGNVNNIVNFENFTYQNGILITSDSLEYVFGEDNHGYYYGEGTAFKTGHLCSKSGDFNNDGYDDLLVSIPYYDNNKGRVYMIYGGVYNISSLYLGNITSKSGLIIYGSKKMSSGTISQTIGDFNNDGFSDIAIREKNPSTITLIYGNKAYNSSIHLGDIDETQGFKILTTNASYTNFGYDRIIDNLGDINGDGYSEIGVAESNYDSDTATIFIIFGNKKHSDIELSKFNSSLGYNITGIDTEAMVRGLGDINGDNMPDILIGSHNSDPFGERPYAGKVFVILGNNTNFNGFDIKNIGSRGFTIYGKNNFDQIGEVICSGLDVNNDGLNDILIGSSNDKDGAYIILGSADTSDIDLKVSLNRFMSIGYASRAEVRSVNSAGDFNNDGFDDFVISYINEIDDRLIFMHYLVFNLYNSSSIPIEMPSVVPSVNPTTLPTVFPSVEPSHIPTITPINQPSVSPTTLPSFIPTANPSIEPSFQPTVLPTPKPSFSPSAKPTFKPSFKPTLKPTFTPPPLKHLLIALALNQQLKILLLLHLH